MKNGLKKLTLRTSRIICNNSSSVSRASISIMSTRMFIYFCQFVTSVILARALQPVGRGQYAILILLPSTIYVLGNLGLGISTGYYSAKQPSTANKLSANMLFASISVTIFYLLILLLLFSHGFFSIFGDYFELGHLLLISAALFFLLFGNYSHALFLGANYITVRNVSRIVESTTLICTLLVLLALGYLNVWSAFSAWVATLAIGHIVLIIFLVRLKFFSLRPDIALFKKCIKMGAKGFLGGVAGFIIIQSDLFMVRYFIDDRATGIYSIAASLSVMLLSVPQSIGEALFPDISKIEHIGKMDGTDKTTRYCRYTIIITVAISAISMALMPFLLKLFYGPGFSDALYPFLILAVAVCAGGFVYVVNSQLYARGLVWIATTCLLVTAVVNTLLNLLLIPEYSFIGAALASLISYSLYSVLLSYFYLKEVKMPASVLIPKVKDFVSLYEFIKQDYLPEKTKRS